MKITKLLALLAFTAVALSAGPPPGPKGGRIVTTAAPHVEFFVAADRTVVVSFYDHALAPVPAAAQAVSATAELKTGKVKLDFAARAGALVTSTPLPAGDGFLIVLHVRAEAGAKPTNYRIMYQEEVCAGCKRPEYACTCDESDGKNDEHNR